MIPILFVQIELLNELINCVNWFLAFQDDEGAKSGTFLTINFFFPDDWGVLVAV